MHGRTDDFDQPKALCWVPEKLGGTPRKGRNVTLAIHEVSGENT